MKWTFGLLIPVVAFLLITTVACSSRRPQPKTAQAVAHSYFNKYGREYKNTPFANKNVDRVTINEIEEVSYRLINTDAIVHFKDGQSERVILKMENKFPGGWRVISWEVLGPY